MYTYVCALGIVTESYCGSPIHSDTNTHYTFYRAVFCLILGCSILWVCVCVLRYWSCLQFSQPFWDLSVSGNEGIQGLTTFQGRCVCVCGPFLVIEGDKSTVFSAFSNMGQFESKTNWMDCTSIPYSLVFFCEILNISSTPNKVYWCVSVCVS